MAVSEVAKIFKSLPKRYKKGGVSAPKTFYFSLGEDEKWTVMLSPDKCAVAEGKTDDADCFFKASADTFLDVWNGKHMPSAKDFLLGRIKSNNPMMLKDFVAAFGIKTQ
jgi:putative sterol carrier protein